MRSKKPTKITAIAVTMDVKPLYTFLPNYRGDVVSLTMPTSQSTYVFDRFPPFFHGLLPEGPMLEALLRKRKIDADDHFEQLMCVCREMLGYVTDERAPSGN